MGINLYWNLDFLYRLTSVFPLLSTSKNLHTPQNRDLTSKIYYCVDSLQTNLVKLNLKKVPLIEKFVLPKTTDILRLSWSQSRPSFTEYDLPQDI